MRIAALAPLAALLTACSSPAADVGSSEQDLGGAHVDATNCEIFVDKVQPILDSHGVHEEVLFIKTLNFRLDAPIAEVGIHYTVHDPLGECRADPTFSDCSSVGKWTELAATPFEGAKDYFSVALDLGNDFTFTHQYEGVIFARTTRGTTYWLKTASRGNFFFDDRGLDDVMRLLGARGYDNFFSSADIGRAPVTADYYPYVNPGLCR